MDVLILIWYSHFLIWTSLLVVGNKLTQNHRSAPKCEGEGFLPDPMDCTKFYRCVENGRDQNGSTIFDRYDFVCPVGTSFDVQQSNCNFPANPTPECKGKIEESLEPIVDKRIYFEDQFFKNPNSTGWTTSTYPGIKKLRKGRFDWSAGKKFKDAEFEKGLLTLGSNSFYSISTKAFSPFSTENDYLFILQYSVKETYDQVCAGSYIKLFDCSLDPLTLIGSTNHLLSFGPEQCDNYGPALKLNLYSEDGNEYDNVWEHFTGYNAWGLTQVHVFTLIMYRDEIRSFEIKYDGRINRSGNFKESLPTFNGWNSICGIGIEVYQSNGGTVFDNILMTNDLQLAIDREKKILGIVSSDD